MGRLRTIPGVPGSKERDFFGSSAALGDIDRDGYADLVIGAVGENSHGGLAQHEPIWGTQAQTSFPTGLLARDAAAVRSSA
jgi:hypothetical protein